MEPVLKIGEPLKAPWVQIPPPPLLLAAILALSAVCASPVAPKNPQAEQGPPVVGLSSWLDAGNVAVVDWSTERADSVTLWPYIGLTGKNGAARIPITRVTTFTLTATNGYGDTVKQTTVSIE
jgi:hypothetical protein